MTEIAQCKCPACGSVGPMQFTPTTWKCKFCGIVDTPSQFKPALPEESQSDPNPHPNLAAAGLTGVMLAAGDIQLSDVQRLAAGFSCVVVPHPTPESELRAAKGALAIILDSPSYRTMEWDALSEINKQRALEIVFAVKSELGFGL